MVVLKVSWCGIRRGPLLFKPDDGCQAGPGRAAASKTESPTLIANLAYKIEERWCKAAVRPGRAARAMASRC